MEIQELMRKLHKGELTEEEVLRLRGLQKKYNLQMTEEEQEMLRSL
jgi:hypothetical protein